MQKAQRIADLRQHIDMALSGKPKQTAEKRLQRIIDNMVVTRAVEVVGTKVDAVGSKVDAVPGQVVDELIKRGLVFATAALPAPPFACI